jgi:acyl carrier protein
VDAPKNLSVDRQRVLDEVRATMVQLGVDPAGIGPASQLVDDLDLDSLDWVDLAMQLEENLSITLTDERFSSLRTVQDVVDRVYGALVEAHDSPA